MSVPVPFGQFVPGDSAIHRLDARVKMALALVFAIAVFSVSSWWALAGFALGIAAACAIASVPVQLAMRGLKPVAWLLAFTVAANALTWGDGAAALHAGLLGLSPTGLVRGLFLALRVLLLIIGSSVLVLTTSPVAVADAISSMLRPLVVVGFPVDDVAMMLSIALRFIPTTAEEAETIVVAQTARGARFDEGGPVTRARAWVPVLVPLFVRLFRRADDLALAMESRCYSGKGRTHLRVQIMRASDWIVLFAGVAALTAVAVML